MSPSTPAQEPQGDIRQDITPAVHALNELQRILDSPSFLCPQDKPLVRVLVGNVRAALSKPAGPQEEKP